MRRCASCAYMQLIEEERRALQHAMQRAAELHAAARRLEAIQAKSAPPKPPVKLPDRRPQTPEAQPPAPSGDAAPSAEAASDFVGGEAAPSESRLNTPEAQPGSAQDGALEPELEPEPEPEFKPEPEPSPSEPLRQAAAEAQDRVNRLRQIIQGPPKLPVGACPSSLRRR